MMAATSRDLVNPAARHRRRLPKPLHTPGLTQFPALTATAVTIASADHPVAAACGAGVHRRLDYCRISAPANNSGKETFSLTAIA